MRTNVRIEIRERGKLIDLRETHNTFLPRGKEWLASLVALTSQDPDVGERSERIRYMGVGIGGVKQQRSDLSDVAPMSTQYPAGSDPQSTSGKEYDDSFPYIWDGTNHNIITTLERPVRTTGGANPYGTAAASDRWLIDDPDFFNTHLTPTEATIHGVIGSGGAPVYNNSTRPQVPVSEAGLFIDETDVDPTDGTTPYKPIVAYVTFGTIVVNQHISVELIWSVKF